MNTQKAIIYARTATAEIVDPAHAIENQLKSIQGYCNENNIEVIAAYHDIAGGHSFDRPGFTDLLDYIRQHEGIINLLVVIDWNRFPRNYPQSILMEERLKGMGVKLVCLKEPNNSFSDFIARQYKNYIHVPD